MSISDQLQEEMEAIESIFFEEFSKISDNQYYVKLNTEHIVVYINIKTEDESYHPDIHLSNKIVKDVPPNISHSLDCGSEWNQFSDVDIEELITVVEEQLIPDIVVVFGIISAVQEFLESLFSRKYATRFAKPTMELSDAQLQGTKVTKESFQEWWDSFKDHVVKEAPKKIKLTGKQLFEQGQVSIKEENNDDGIDVDYSLFEDE
eukprot:NODE_11_length_54881_cov_1.430718.p29 type:complete len:205 gc:universal NODE_11_length_54881_cov_1.430718:7574-8188(+)